MDITDIPYPDDSFDLIICIHVLQYVEDEKRGLEEIHRVLGHGGSAVFCDNVNPALEKTLEDKAYDTPKLREEYYGNAQYVRRYGRDYKERLGSVWGNEIVRYRVDDLDPEEIKNYYLRHGEELCIYTKQPAT